MFSKFTDLKLMLDSNREPIKMDAMKRIINVIKNYSINLKNLDGRTWERCF